MTNKAKKVAYLGLMAAVALILSYVEALFPPIYAAVPGIKVGLPNIVIIFMLYRFGLKEAAAVSLVRLAAVALLFGSVMTLAYSLAGAVLSLTLMALCKRFNIFTTVGVSVVGGVSHNLGQIIVAMIVMETAQIGYYMVVLAITGTIAGVFIGLAGNLLLKYMKNVK
ncbi:MAG: Gx transporter family protein [Oscillospiraceae bacterium]|nr:Gx transporter family protein [Oscillospiraceae bacterium]